MIFVGIDWAEDHHDLCLRDEAGAGLGTRRVPDTVEGVRQIHDLLGGHVEAPEEAVVGIETDSGLLPKALVAAGYQVYVINPLAASRYRDRHRVSGAKSDAGDAKVLADLVRTDRHNHRLATGETELSEAIKALARAHQSLVWSSQRQANQLRSTLRIFYPGALAAFGSDLNSPDALAVLGLAPTPCAGRRLTTSQIAAALRKGGRRRNVDKVAERIHDALRAPQLEATDLIADAYGEIVRAAVAVLVALANQIERLEAELADRLWVHPDSEILLSLPGLGPILGARVLGEFGDDRSRFKDPKARKAYAGTAPITRASGTRHVVLARRARNKRLADACQNWAFCALTCSPGARHHYNAQRAKGKTNSQALRSLANRLVGILHGCLMNGELYREDVAWPSLDTVAA